MKKKKPPLVVQYDFADGTHAHMSLLELEEARLWEMHNLLNNANGRFQELGEQKLRQIAARLAAERNVTTRSRAGSAVRAADLRAIGDRKAQLVRTAIAKGRAPPASPRHVRRIKKRQK